MLMALIIAAIAYTISHIVDALDRRTRFSGVVVAGTIVALVSSLPEFTSSLVSLFSNSKIGPSEAACNLMGGNLFRTIMFAAVLICFITQIKKLKTTKTIVISVVTQIIIFALYIVFTIGWWSFSDNNDSFLYTSKFKDIIFGSFAGIVILAYAFNIWYMYQKSKRDKPTKIKEKKDDYIKGKWLQAKFYSYFNKCNVTTMLLIFLLCSISIILCAIFLGVTSNSLIQSWGWGGEEAGNQAGFGTSLLLGISTSIPEIVMVITLLRLKNINTAFSDIFGSNMFSILILAILTFLNMGNQQNIFGEDNSLELGILSIWGFLAISFLGLLILVNFIYVKKNLAYKNGYYTFQIIFLSLCVCCYIVYIVTSFTNTNEKIFDWLSGNRIGINHNKYLLMMNVLLQ